MLRKSLLVAALAGALVAFAVRPHGHAVPTRAAVAADLARLPLAFEPNVGQAGRTTRFLTRQPGYALLIGATGARMFMRHSELSLNTLGSSPRATVSGASPLPGRVNYFHGRSAHTGIATFGRVDVTGVYPGVDLAYSGRRGRVEYTFTLAPGADPAAIRLGVGGASALRLDGNGDLVARTRAGTVVQHAPLAYQTIGGSRRAVHAAFTLHGRRVGFTVSGYDKRAPLVIDPVLTYSTYMGGIAGSGQAYGVALTASGDIVVTGSTFSSSFPFTEGGSYANGADAYVIELDPSGSSVVYSTYIGGNGQDQATGVALDPSGDAYITGFTNSDDYPLQASSPTTNDANPRIGTNFDAFVTELSPTGNALVYSTIVGGSGSDEAEAIAVGSDGAAYITGLTSSPSTFKITTGSRPVAWSAFVTKLVPATSPETIAYSRLLGGSGASSATVATAEQALTEGQAIAVDSSGNAYVGGVTLATSFPTTAGAYDSSMGSAATTGFVAKVSADGSTLDWSTRLGGSGDLGEESQVNGLALAGTKVVVAGATTATDFPTTTRAFSRTNGGSTDGFVAELNPATTGAGQLVYSTFLGGTGYDAADAVAADAKGDVYVTGRTASTDFPTKSPFSPSTASPGNTNAFVARLEPAKSGTAGLIWSSYLGGGGDAGLGIAQNGSGSIFAVGETSSLSFPTVNSPIPTPVPFQTTGFLSEIAETPSHILSLSATSGTAGDPVTITGAGFTGATAVKFGGVAAPGFTVDSDTQISGVTVPALAVDGDVTVTTPDGTSNGAPFDVVPLVDSFTPTNGVAGQVVNVTGRSLVKPTALTLNGLKIPFTTVSPGTHLRFTLPVTATSGVIEVTTANGVADAAAPFTVDPKITSLSPLAAAGGVSVKILGSGLAGATDVSFTQDGGLVSATPTSDTATAIVVPVPDDATVGPVSVVTPAGPAQSTASFKPLPKVSGFLLADGVFPGTVTITGTNLLDATTVKVGTVAETPSVDTATQIQVPIPGPPFSSGKVTVTTPAGTSVSAALFEVSALTSFTPLKAAANATVTIVGRGLGSTTTVDFAGAPGQTPTSVSPTAVKVKVPGTAVAGTLTVHTGTGDLTSAAQFTPLPKITGYDQTAYQEGDPVVITGTNLTGGTFALGTHALVDSGGSNATQFDATVPTGAITAAVTVTTGGNKATGPLLHVRPTIAPLAPARGTTGTVLTLTGSTFTGTKSVLFGSTHVPAIFKVVSPTELHVTVPAAATTGVIAVTNAGGTTDSGTFTVDPAITSFSPTSGAAGATVTVHGSGFDPGDQASIGSTAATLTYVSPTSVKVVAPPGVTTGDVEVWLDGAHKAQSATPFTVTFSATQLEQTVAPGGSTITIDGVGLEGVTSVHFDTVTATPASIAADGSSLTVVVPSTGVVDGTVSVYKSATSHTTVPGTFTRLTVDPPNTIAAPGDTLTLNGDGFTGALVQFVNTPGGLIGMPLTPTSVNPGGTVLTVTVPIGFTGGDVQVVPVSGSLFSVTDFLMGLSAWSGHVGDSVHLAGGFGLSLVTAVTIGGVAANVTNVTGTTDLDFTITSGETTGIVDAGGTSSTTPFQVEPHITGLTPNSGPTGTSVELSGDHLANVTVATVDGINVFGTVSGNTAAGLTITIPDGASAGQISVTNADGTTTASFAVTLSITGFNPFSGPVGSQVTITGIGFTGATGVSFNGTPATTFHVDSGTQITATVPAGATDGPLSVTTPVSAVTSGPAFSVTP